MIGAVAGASRRQDWAVRALGSKAERAASRSRQDMTGTGASSAPMCLAIRRAGMDWGTRTGLIDLGGEAEMIN